MHMKSMAALALLLLTGCGAPQEPAPPTTALEPAVEYLSPTEHLVRASMALRGVRPSLDEITAVAQDPGALEGLVDGWLQSEAFGATIRDMHAEALLVRSEGLRYPQLGPLFGVDGVDIVYGISEAPLKLIEDIVLRDAPYTEIVTAQSTLTNEVGAIIFGQDWDPSGEEWQVTTWGDARPVAGILSESALWLRHISDGSNYHRGRANLIADALLCSDFLGRDIAITSDVDLSDDAAVADAVNSQAECVGCHQALDPLAGLLWGFRGKINQTAVLRAYQDGYCDGTAQGGQVQNCFPLTHYRPQLEDRWEEVGLREPGYFGMEALDLEDLGQLIAADPRFSLCTAKRFWGYLAQQEVGDVPLEIAAPLQDVFVQSGYSARTLARTIVLSDAFRVSHATAEDAGMVHASLQVLRPQQAARMLEDLTGFAWLVDLDPRVGGIKPCVQNGDCNGVVNMVTTSGFGFEAMTGGIDSNLVLVPTHTTTPIKSLFSGAVAAEAAGYVVGNDVAADPAERRLLTALDGEVTEDVARAQLVALHARVLGEVVADDSVEVDASYALFATALAASDPVTAWTVVLTAFLQDTSLLFY